MRELVHQTDLLLLDFDGTFYKFTEELVRNCSDAVFGAASALGLPVSREEAVRLGAQSYERHGAGFFLFQEKFGVKAEDWAHAYQDSIECRFVTSMQVSAQHFNDCSARMAVLSHSLHFWVAKVLAKFGMEKSIPDHLIFGYDDVGYRFKHPGTEAYRYVLDKVGVAAERTVMVDDSARNLYSAKSLGMTTVYVSQGGAFNTGDHPYVDHVVEDLSKVLGCFKARR